MSEETKLTAQELKQSILSRMDTARKEVEELSEEELESIAGGCWSATCAIPENGSDFRPWRTQLTRKDRARHRMHRQAAERRCKTPLTKCK